MKFNHITNSAVALVALIGLFNISIPAMADSNGPDAWNGSVLRPYDGYGQKEHPVLIYSAEEFAFLLQNYDHNNGVNWGKYYRLENDIDMAGCLWSYGLTMSDNKSFRSHFDGGGHKISNLHIVVGDFVSEVNVGVFPQLGGDETFVSCIENLEIENFLIEFKSQKYVGEQRFNIGGLVGKMMRNSEIKNCIVNGMRIEDNHADIDLTNGGCLNVGSLVGKQQNDFDDDESPLDNINITDSYSFATAQLRSIKGEKRLTLEQGTKFEGVRNGYRWYKRADGHSFFPCLVTIVEQPSDASGRHFAALVEEGRPAKYVWLVDGKEQNSTINECTVPFDAKDRTIAIEVYDNKGNIIGTDAELVQPGDLKVVIEAQKTGNNYTLTSKIIGQGSNALGSEFLYSWRDMTLGEEVVGSSVTLTGAQPGHTYLLVANHRRWKFCAISNYYSFANPIYVCLNGINASDAEKYTIDGTTTYPQGDDNNDGLSPEKAVRTLKKAYSLLKSERIGGNIIVIMGDYTNNEFNYYLDEKMSEKNPDYFVKDKKAIITGQYGNIANGRLQLASRSCLIDEDTRFENLTLHGDPNGDMVAEIMAQEHDITMGYGIQCDFNAMTAGRGLINGSNAPDLSIFGGHLDPTNPTIAHQVNTIRLLSGYYGRIIAGGQTSKLIEQIGNVHGTPRNPIRTNIVIDICNYNNPISRTFDVALTVAGQSNGSCYAVTNIEVKGTSRVGRAVGGNLGYGRKAWTKNRAGVMVDRPSDSFYGQSTINILGGNINEIYGANLGRNGNIISTTEEVIDSVTTYFYGKSVINISGGQVRNTIYGSGGGGVTGLAYDDEHHTFDPYIPYTLSNGEIAYGPYSKAKRKMPRVYVEADSVIDLNHTTTEINIFGNARLRGTVYGGGHGYSNQIRTSMASCQAGCMFGDTHVNMWGGTVDGYVYGGGRGSTAYYDNNDLSGYPMCNGVQQTKHYFKRLALVYGKTEVNITGGKVLGMVFSGGEGSYYRPTSDTDPENSTTGMASVIGSTTLNIGGEADLDDFVFGGGNYGNVLKSTSDPESGSTYINITGGKIKNSIFGGGHGHVDHLHPERSIVAEVEGDTHVNITGGRFSWTPEPSRYDTVRFYGIFGSGRNASIVHGDTHLRINHSLFSQDFIEASGLISRKYEKPWDRFYTICGGGFGELTDVMGDTNVLIDLKDEGTLVDIFGGGLEGNVEGSTNITVSGKTTVRNVYGGSLVGNVGIRDMSLNGNMHTPNSDVRDYQTNTTINFLTGKAYQIFGGGLMGNVSGETFVNIGSYDTEGNQNLNIVNVYGGNDVSGTIAGSNNPNYGTNINIYGGTISGDIYGSGNGQYGQYDQPSPDYALSSLLNSSVGREHPHVAATSINISGTSEDCKTIIEGSLYVGGNNTTIGQFVRDINDRPEYGMLREVPIANSGSARVNIGNHVSIGDLVMGSNGTNLINFIPQYTKDGSTWLRGFESDEAFEHFCRGVDMPCVPQLTFNSNRSFSNNYAIDGNNGQYVFDTPGEMDATDITINNFVGGGSCGSMTSDNLYSYTLPTGVTITGNVIAGCQNAHFTYTETEGRDAGKTRDFVGGFVPYSQNNYAQVDRIQLNLFCNFHPVKRQTENEKTYYRGSNVFGGCYDYGVIHGITTVNMHSDLLGGDFTKLQTMAALADNNYVYGCQVFGGGRGDETEVIGKTKVNVSTATFNGQVCEPKILSVYGGGQMGNVVVLSRQRKGHIALAEVGTEVNILSGMVDKVFGGARMAAIEGGASVKVGYKDKGMGKAMINTVFGGSDVSGTIVGGNFVNAKGEKVQTNTYVLVTESNDARPQINEIYTGGNGNYGVHSTGDTYAEGEIETLTRHFSLAGVPYPNLDSTYLDIAGGDIKFAFGGANSSQVRQATTIDVDYSGYVERLFGGNNNIDMSIQPKWNLYRGKVGTVYGGCNQGNVIYYNEAEDRLVNPATSGEVGLALDLIHPDFEADNVFGGCRMGNVKACKIENGELVPVVFASNQYGTYINVKAGKFGKVFGGNDVSGNIFNGTRIQIEGGTIEDVFGAGNGEYIYQYSTDVDKITECYNEKAGEYYYKIPASDEFGGKDATPFQKMQAIASFRPNIVKSFIEIAGGMQNGERQMAYVTHGIFGGGNCATINKNENRSGEIRLQIGDYCEIENLFMGSNGEPHQKTAYIKKILDYNNMGNLAQTDEYGRTLLDHHMDAVIMHGLPQDFQFHRHYDKCYIGSFFLGGNRGSLMTHGDLSIAFPRTLKIRDKIVGGSNRADIIVKNKDDEEDIVHNGGILWDGIGNPPEIILDVNCMFLDENGEETSSQIYSGCYQSGKIEGEVKLIIND